MIDAAFVGAMTAALEPMKYFRLRAPKLLRWPLILLYVPFLPVVIYTGFLVALVAGCIFRPRKKRADFSQGRGMR